jgi:hypothetical protein
LSGLISAAPFNIGQNNDAEIVARLDEDIREVHLVGTAVEQKGVT